MILFEETDQSADEPEFWFEYQGNEYPAWSSPRGRMKTDDYDLAKFNRFAKIGQRADDIEAELKQTIKDDPSSNDARCAYACLLMMNHGIRTGNELSAEGYESGLEDNKGEIVQTFGVSTLLNDHISFNNDVMKLNFLGKTQVEHEITIDNKFMVMLGKFYYKHKNKFNNWLGLDYNEIYKFVRDVLGKGFIPKDFRTFRGNIEAWKFIENKLDNKVETKTEANKIIKSMVLHAASILGNTEGVCRSSYLDSRMIDWIKDQLVEESNN